MASKDEYRVSVGEVVAALGWGTGEDAEQIAGIADAAERMGFGLAADWAGRASLTPADAGKLLVRLRDQQAAAETEAAQRRAAQDQTWTLPPVRNKHGELVPSVIRPGDGYVERDAVAEAGVSSVW